MEARALYDIKSVLIVDSDEFLYCDDNNTGVEEGSPHILGGYQRQAMQSLYQSATTNNVHQLSFTRYSPMYPITSAKGNRDECMLKAILGGTKSIFSCFAPLNHRRLNYLPKSLVINFLCPRIFTHDSCITKPQSHECTCNTVVPQQCFVIHVRSTPLKPEKENTVVRTTQRLELNSIMKSIPRPIVPIADTAMGDQQSLVNFPALLQHLQNVRKKSAKVNRNHDIHAEY